MLLSLLWFFPCTESPVVYLAFGFLFPSSKPGIEMSGRVTHSFITQTYWGIVLICMANVGLQHPFSSFWKGGGRRQVSDHMALLPSYLIESTGTWARETGKWSVFVGCRSCPREDGENGLWWTASSLPHAYYLQSVCALVMFTMTCGGECIFEFIP